MSALTDALHEFAVAGRDWERVKSNVVWASKRQMETEREAAAQRFARAADAYESALAQFTADVARHAVT